MDWKEKKKRKMLSNLGNANAELYFTPLPQNVQTAAVSSYTTEKKHY